MNRIDVASAAGGTPAGNAKATENGAGKDDGFSQIFDTMARQPGRKDADGRSTNDASSDNADAGATRRIAKDNGLSRILGATISQPGRTDSDGGAANDAPLGKANAGYVADAIRRIGGSLTAPGNDQARADGGNTAGARLIIDDPLHAATISSPEGRRMVDGVTSAGGGTRDLEVTVKTAINAQRIANDGKRDKTGHSSRMAGNLHGNTIDSSSVDMADRLTRLSGLAGETDEQIGQKATPLSRERSEADIDALSGNDQPLQSASDMRDALAAGADELTGLLGFATASAQNAQDAQDAGPRTALRHNAQLQFPTAAETVAEQPRTARIVVTGRETHFAPVNLPTAADQGPASSPVTKGTPADARRTRGDGTDIRQATDAVAGARLTAEKTGDGPQPNLQPAGTQTGDVQAISATDNSGTGALVRLADQIAAQARDLSTPASSAAAAAQAQQSPHAGGPVRILRLQLQPEELGVVTARLRIVNGVLELRLTADRQQSVEVLKQDSDGLLEALRRAGYTAEIASIEFARPSAPAAQTPANPSGQSLAQGFAGDSGGSASNNAGQTPDQHNGREGADRQSSDESGAGASGTLLSDDAQAIYL